MEQSNTFVGAQIGNYRVIEELASGSFGDVYRVQHLFLTERMAVIKILHTLRLGATGERESFLREAQFLEKLKHPRILPIFDVGLYQNIPYIVAEYAQHGSLRDLLKRQRGQALPLKQSLTILSQVSEALYYAHQQNIIHRDLKPENILFNGKDEALLADFGLATTLNSTSMQTEHMAGTPLYMAPEQFKGKVSRGSDQYALACIAYELMTGQPPFEPGPFIAMAYQHVHEQPKPPRQINPALPEYMEQAILKALAKDRHNRYPSVVDFMTALQTPTTQPKVNVPPPPPTEAPRQTTWQQPVQNPVIAPPPPVESLVQNNTWNNQQVFSPIPLKPRTIAEAAPKADGGDRFLAALGYLIPLIALFFLGSRRPFLRFHSMQSVLLFCAVFIAAILYGMVAAATNTTNTTVGSIIISYMWIFLIIVYIIIALIGKSPKLPLIGQISERHALKVFR